jgi:hypothetical protein
MNRKRKRRPIWIAVQVWRGIPVEVKAFHDRQLAEKRESAWRKKMHVDYDETGLFAVRVQ